MSLGIQSADPAYVSVGGAGHPHTTARRPVQALHQILHRMLASPIRVSSVEPSLTDGV